MKLLAFLLPALLALAGCIAPPSDAPGAQTEEGVAPAGAIPPPADRVDGMTATETKQDRDVDCPGTVPAGACAERDLLVVGRIGVESLPVHLWSTNGAIRIVAGAGDAWELHAVYRVQAASKDEARKGLDTAWTWTHEADGKHVLRAGPTRDVASVPLPLLAGATRVIAAKYEVVLPAWVVLDLKAETANGALDVAGIQARTIELDTSNGAIDVVASAAKVDVSTSNGAIDAILRPTEDGRIDLDTSNGAIELALLEGPRHGYDLEADTSNGRVEILLRDGTAEVDRTSGTFRTSGYETRDVQTTVRLGTSNGAITVAPA